MPAGSLAAIATDVREALTREKLHRLMQEIARRAPGARSYRVFIVGGGTAVWVGWRESTVDADLYAKHEEVFRDVQAIKELLGINVEFVRPEDFVPPLAGSKDRHVFVETIDRVSFYHYDPYAQLFSKIVRGFRKDLVDARHFIDSGMVESEHFRSLVHGVPDAIYAKYPAVTQQGVLDAVDSFLKDLAAEPRA